MGKKQDYMLKKVSQQTFIAQQHMKLLYIKKIGQEFVIIQI